MEWRSDEILTSAHLCTIPSVTAVGNCGPLWCGDVEAAIHDCSIDWLREGGADHCIREVKTKHHGSIPTNYIHLLIHSQVITVTI